MFPNLVNFYSLLFFVFWVIDVSFYLSFGVRELYMFPNQCLIVNDFLWPTFLPHSCTLLLDCLRFDWKSWCSIFKGFVFFPFLFWKLELDPVVGILFCVCVCVLVCREINQYVRINVCCVCVSSCKIRQHAYGPCPFSNRSVHYLCSKYGIILNEYQSTSDVNDWGSLDDNE